MNKDQHDEVLNTPGFEQLRKLLCKHFYHKMIRPGPNTMKQETIQIIQQLQKEGYTIHEFKG
jgi:hypothetical protein